MELRMATSVSSKAPAGDSGIELERIAPAAVAPVQLERIEAPQLTLEQSIAKIDAFITQGKKLCLFVGRTPREPLPSDRGEAKPDEVWVSLDESNAGPAVSADRIHLQFNFNHQNLIRKLNKKFDLIVVDFSVIKFLSDDFANRFRVMFRTSETRMMFESSLGIHQEKDIPKPIFSTDHYMVTSPISMTLEDIERKEAHVEEYRAKTSAEQQKIDWDAFMKKEGNSLLESFAEWPESEKKHELEIGFREFLAEQAGIKDRDEEIVEFGKQRLKAHLEKTFAHVELIEDRPYPYETHYQRNSYFIVSNPKQANCCCQLV